MSQDPEKYDVTASDQDVEGEMGVSSERVGDAGPNQRAPTGTRDTSEPDDDAPEEPVDQDVNAGRAHPKAGYNSHDPKSDEAPYEPGRHDGV